jgi:hypothetical protein
MSTIKIEGAFSGSINNHVQIDIYRPNPESYNFSKEYSDDFNIDLTDLKPDTEYFFDLTGYTAGVFTIKVTGDVENEIDNEYKNDFKPGLVIKTLS